MLLLGSCSLRPNLRAGMQCKQHRALLREMQQRTAVQWGGNTAGEGEHSVHVGRNLHGWRGQVQNGIHFSGNSPASSVDRRLNLDIPVWEGGGGEGTAGSAALL